MKFPPHRKGKAHTEADCMVESVRYENYDTDTFTCRACRKYFSTVSDVLKAIPVYKWKFIVLLQFSNVDIFFVNWGYPNFERWRTFQRSVQRTELQRNKFIPSPLDFLNTVLFYLLSIAMYYMKTNPSSNFVWRFSACWKRKS